MSYYHEYIKAFGDVQQEWLDTTIKAKLGGFRYWLLSHIPQSLAARLIKYIDLIIVRSFVSGGHKIQIIYKHELVAEATFKINDRGWYMVDHAEEEAES